MFGIIPDWLPTKEDEANNRKALLQQLKEELPRVAREFSNYSQERDLIEEALIKSFSKEQHKMWMDLKVMSQKVQFNYSKMQYNQKRMNEILFN